MATTAAPIIRAPRGTKLRCKGWQQEAALRCLMNNLDPENAERPADLVVYGGIGKAARNWECYHAIVRELERLGGDETLLVQSGKPVAVFPTHEMAPRVLIANSNLVGKWANWEHFNELDRKGLMMYGQMTAGSWIYIGTQGILQGTFQTFAALAERHFARRAGLARSRASWWSPAAWAAWVARSRFPSRSTAAWCWSSKWTAAASSAASRRAIATCSPKTSTKRCAFAKRLAAKAARFPWAWWATAATCCRRLCAAACRWTW